MKPLYGPLHRPLDGKFHRDVSARVERWLGPERVAQLRLAMRDWYGGPICILDVPGSVWIHRDGTFTGKFVHGYFVSAYEVALEYTRRLIRESGRVQHGQFAAGFTSVGDALSRASQGYSQRCPFQKTGPTGVSAVTSSLWRVGNSPAAGSAPGNAPGGTAFSSSDTGALAYANPASGTNHLVGADVSCNLANSTLLLYDLIFGCNKTMASTTSEAVTGVPTRYQSTTASAADYIGDNFGFVQVGGTALAATAHNWTTCTYTDQGGAASTLPSLTGNASAIVDRLDHPTNQWFAPLGSGDVGIGAWTAMQCSASVATGAVWFMIGHPLGFMALQTVSLTYPFDWLTNRDQAPRIFDNACLAFLDVIKPGTGAASFTGRIYATNAAP